MRAKEIPKETERSTLGSPSATERTLRIGPEPLALKVEVCCTLNTLSISRSDRRRRREGLQGHNIGQRPHTSQRADDVPPPSP